MTSLVLLSPVNQQSSLPSSLTLLESSLTPHRFKGQKLHTNANYFCKST